MSSIVDLRSDTVTRPTPEMYEAMASAALGDDVLGDDPTVQELERAGAAIVGMEAALFVPSGTMGNQIALACHVQRGDAILIEEEAHIAYYEVGAPAIIAGAMTWTLPSDHGVIDPDLVRSRVLKRNLHTPGTTLLCLENTHNRAGGTVIPIETMKAYHQIARETGMKVHLDGARVFNAAVALGVDVQQITNQVDTVNFCLSKGLSAPVGSLLCGPASFIEEAIRWRKRLGGGMRQAGLLAACGLVSLRMGIGRLAEDHKRALKLARAISEMPGLTVDLERVHTNIVLVHTERSADLIQSRLEELEVRCFAVAPHRLRLVVHANVDDSGIDRAIAAFRLITSA